MAGVRKRPQRNGKYAGWFTDAQGRIRHFVGVRSKADTLRMAQRLEDDHRQVRLGYRPAPAAAQKHRTRPFAEVADEYYLWGTHEAQWSVWHERQRRRMLAWWMNCLNLKTLGDLEGVLPRVEAELRKLDERGLAASTRVDYAEGLHAFCLWCKEREYLAADPLVGMAQIRCTPGSVRRALAPDEIYKLLEIAPDYRRLLYETALTSGLRAGELRALTPDDLDTERGGIRLRSEVTKNRESGLQPIPAALLRRLAEFGAAETAKALYDKWGRGGAFFSSRIPEKPLLYVPHHTARLLRKDLEAAGIRASGPGGVVDFHALRTTFVTMVLGSGTDLKTAMTLARHKTPNLTLHTYARVQEERLRTVAELVGAAVRGDVEGAEMGADLVVSLRRKAAGAEGFDARAITSSTFAHRGWWRQGDSKRTDDQSPDSQKPHTSCATSDITHTQSSCCKNTEHHDNCNSRAPSAHLPSTNSRPDLVVSLHDRAMRPDIVCAIPHAPDAPDDLAEIVRAWPMLPQAIKDAVLAVVLAAGVPLHTQGAWSAETEHKGNE